MQTSGRPKTNPLLVKELLSGNPVRIHSGLERLKEVGNEAYLPVLFDMLELDPAIEIKKEILSILGNIKLIRAPSFFADALSDNRYQRIKKELLTACWQNGLDYSEYFPLIIQIIINEDWETGFEAFTIIENSEFLPEEKICNAEIAKIKSAIFRLKLEDNKKYLLKEVVAILENG